MKKQLNRWVYSVIGVLVMLFAGLVYAWSVLSMPIAREFTAWTKSQLSLTFTIVMIMFCVGGLVSGKLTGKLKSRVYVWISAVLFLAGFLLASTTQSLAMLYIGFGVLCGFASGFVYNAVMSTICKWFPDKQGLISGILLMGFGIGSFLVGKVYQAFTPATIGGWRISFRVIGIVIFVVLALCSILFVRPDASFVPPSSGNAKKKGKILAEKTTGEMLRSPSFWLFFAWAIVLSAAGLSLISQASGVASEVGQHVSEGTIATVVGLISICNGLGRIAFGGMFDAIGRSKTMQTVNLLFIVTAAILIVALKTGSFAILVVGFIVGGLAYSGITPTNSAFVNTYFGPTNYPVNLPMINLNLIIASFGSTVAGALYDATSSYFAVYILMAGLAVAGILLSMAISVFDKKLQK